VPPADVSRVQNAINLAEDIEDLGPEQSVGVGDDAQTHW
jgi:hypothetical protein